MLGFNPDEKNVPMFTAPSKTLTTFGRTHKQHNSNMIKEMARGKNADYPQCRFFFFLFFFFFFFFFLFFYFPLHRLLHVI